MEASTVGVISREILKPSSQTPHHLKNLKLSVLERLHPPVYIPLIFFYEKEELNTHDQMSQKLKRSLSDILTTFYPLAGKLDQESFTVDCADDGVLYVEAKVHARLSDAIQDPTTKQLKLYLPVSPANITENILLAVQINFFDCGGVAIGLCLSHQIADGLSAVTFMNSWAATCREGVQIPRPNLDLADHFPDTDNGRKYSLSSLVVPEEVFVTKRLVFDTEKLAALRKIATSSKSSNAVKDPTRVELVSAFIWKHFIEAAKSKKLYSCTAATHAVNLRKRMVPPPCLEHVFGNCYMNIATIFDHDKGFPEIHDLVLELRIVLRVLNDEYIRKLQSQDEDGYVSGFNKLFDQLSKGGMEYCCFSSWCRFPVYEVNYGWGKPVWVCTTGFSLLNTTVLMDAKSGDGIEAWINTLPDHVKTLESHVKLLVNPVTGDNGAALQN